MKINIAYLAAILCALSMAPAAFAQTPPPDDGKECHLAHTEYDANGKQMRTGMQGGWPEDRNIDNAACLKKCKKWFEEMKPRGATRTEAICRQNNIRCCGSENLGLPMEKNF